MVLSLPRNTFHPFSLNPIHLSNLAQVISYFFQDRLGISLCCTLYQGNHNQHIKSVHVYLHDWIIFLRARTVVCLLLFPVSQHSACSIYGSTSYLSICSKLRRTVHTEYSIYLILLLDYLRQKNIEVLHLKIKVSIKNIKMWNNSI